VMIGKTPKVRRVDSFGARAKTIERFQTEKRSRERPILHLIHLFKPERIDSALFECKWRVAERRTAFGHVDGSRCEQISVVQMAVELLRGLHVVNHGNDVPGNVGQSFEGLIPALVWD